MACDDISSYLAALDRDACYRVETVLKTSPHETTEKVWFVGANGAEQGPFVRKRFDLDSGLGTAYERLWEAQRAGRRFLHVPRVHDCYTRGNDRAIVMEYVEGETMQETLRRCAPSLELAKNLFVRTCDAVVELHENFNPPIIHRDLKPSNIVVSAYGLTLIDFGIARSYEQGKSADTRQFGTRPFAPPEQFGFGQTDVRSDVYALGLILYCCLAGVTPTAESRKGGFVDVAAPQEMRSVMVKATMLDPADRYQSVRELKDAFNEACREKMTFPAHSGNPVLAESGTGAGMAAGGKVPSAVVSPQTEQNDGRRPRIGGVRTIVVSIGFLVWVAASVSCMIDPYQSSSHPQTAEPWIRLQFALLGFGVGVPVAWLLLDRHAFREAFPRIPRCFFERTVRRCLAVIAGSMLAVGVLGAAFPA